MLAAIRTFAKSWAAKVLLAMVMLSFLFVGARSGLPSLISNDVVTAGSRHIAPLDFKRMFDNYKHMVEQQSGQTISLKDAVDNGLDKRVLQEVAGSEATLEYLHRAGVQPADQLVGDQLRQEKDFFDPVTGKFDQKAYEQKLNSVNLTAPRYEGLLRDQIAQNHLSAGLAAGLRAPLTYGALIAGFELESRNFTYFILDPRQVPPPAAPTDAQLLAFIKQNASRLMQPEMRTLTLVRFSAKALAPSLPVDEAAVRKLYDFRKDAASTPEKRTLVEVPVKDEATAATVAKRLKAGETPAAVAASVGAQPIAYNDVAKSGVADPTVANVAFALKPGEVSGAIQSSLAGYAVVIVKSVTPAKAPDFEAMRPALEAQARTDAAGQKIYDQVQKFEDAHGGGAGLTDAAKTAGVSPMTVGPVNANGLTPLGQPAPGMTPKLLKDAFGLGQNGESDVEDDGAGEYYIVRVDKITPPALPTLQDPNLKQALTRVYMGQELVAKLQARAAELIQRLHKGEGLEAVAASTSATVGHANAVTRAAMVKNQSLSPELLQKMFAAKAGDVITGPTAQFAVMVARVDAVQPVALNMAAPFVAAQNRQVSGQIFQDLNQSVRASAAAVVKPKIYPDRAATALGVSPSDLPKASGAAKGPAQ